MSSCRSCASIRPRCPGESSAACCRTLARTAACTRRTFQAAESRTRPRRRLRSPTMPPLSATCSTRCDCARWTCWATRTDRWPPSSSRSRGPSRSVAYYSPARRYSMLGNARLSTPGRGRRTRARMARIWSRNGSASAARAACMPRSRVSVRISPQRCARATRRPGARRPVNYAAGERLPLVRQPVLLLRPRDEFWDMTGRAEAFFREVRRLDLPEHNGGLFDTGSVEVARYAREFLDR